MRLAYSTREDIFALQNAYPSHRVIQPLSQDWLEMHEEIAMLRAEIARLNAELDSLQTTVSASDCVKKPSNCQAAEHFKFGKCTKRHGHTGIHNSDTGVWLVDNGTYCLSMPIAEWLGLLAEAALDRPQSHLCRERMCVLPEGHEGTHRGNGWEWEGRWTGR